MAKKKPAAKPQKTQDTTSTINAEEFLVLGHLIKYNLYLLTKSVVFSAVLAKSANSDDAISITNKVMSELDLDTKRRSESVQ